MGLRDLDENLRIDDEKLKQLIIDVFNEKYKYMSKSNYLRWINTSSINERIKNLTVDLMSEEDIEKHPNYGGYYTFGENHISLKNVDNHTIDHETNHFISDPIEFDKKNERFSRYIDEGITEYLTKNITNAPFIAYSQNVYFVKLLHSIFGDELIKCYLTGVTSDFYNRLERLIKVNEEDSINDFESVLANLMKYLHNQDFIKYYSNINELTEEETNTKFKKYVENILVNSIKEEMINFDYYDEDGNIDVDLLKSVINTRSSILNDLNRYLEVKIEDNISYKLLKHALNHSYLGKYYSNDELNKLIDNCISNGNLSSTSIKDLYKDRDNKLFYALEMRIENKNYNEGKSLDFSNLLFDFFKLLATNKFNDRDLYEKLIKTYLYEKIGGNINVDAVSNILKTNFNYFYHVSKIALSNEKNFSDSQIASVNMYMLGIDTYVEKRDKDLFLIEYNKKNDDLTSHKISFSDISYRKDYPHLGHLRLKEGFKYVELYFDENFENVMYNGKSYQINGSYQDLFNNRIIEESKITNFEDYIHYLNDGKDDRIEGAHYLGDNFDLLNTNSRFIDYESMCNSIKDKISVFNDGLKKSILKQNIENILKKAYGQMDISDDLVDSITNRAYSFAMNNKIKGFDEYNIKLIKDWREYISSVEATYVVELSTKEAEEKLNNKIKTENRIKNIKKYNSEYAQKEANYIEEKNSEYFDELDLSYGIIDMDYVVGKNKYSYPSAKKINYRLFVEDVKEGLLNVPDEYKVIYINIYLENLTNNLGLCSFLSFGQDVDYYKNEIKEQIKKCIENDEEPDIEELNSLTDKIITLFSDNREKMIDSIKNSKAWYGKYTSNMTKHIYEKLEEISNNENLSKGEKEIKTQVLVDVANEDIQKRKEDEDYVISLQMEKILENDKRWKKVY